jgi:hypothetical protein
VIIHLESLIGAHVKDIDGVHVGRIEEVRCIASDNRCVVESYLVGASAVIHRLRAWTLIRPIRHALPKWLYRSYRVPASQLDMRNPAKPTMLIPFDDLRGASS